MPPWMHTAEAVAHGCDIAVPTLVDERGKAYNQAGLGVVGMTVAVTVHRRWHVNVELRQRGDTRSEMR